MGIILSSDQKPVPSPVPGIQGIEEKEEVSTRKPTETGESKLTLSVPAMDMKLRDSTNSSSRVKSPKTSTSPPSYSKIDADLGISMLGKSTTTILIGLNDESIEMNKEVESPRRTLLEMK